MKKIILKIINRLFRPFGAKLVRIGAKAQEPVTQVTEPEDSGPNLSMGSMLRRLAERGVPFETIVDIGASDGKWSITCMEDFPKASYLAIEPLEERQEALERAKTHYSNFDYALCVAGEVDGEDVSLNVTPDLDGTTVEGENSGTSRTCRVRTIDSLVSENSLQGPYLLKFDTHGYEIPILEGCKDVFKNTSAIIMETYNFQLTPTSLRFPEMCAHMESLGFRPVDIAEPMLRAHDDAFWQADILFLRTDADVFHYPHYQ